MCLHWLALEEEEQPRLPISATLELGSGMVASKGCNQSINAPTSLSTTTPPQMLTSPLNPVDSCTHACARRRLLLRCEHNRHTFACKELKTGLAPLQSSLLSSSSMPCRKESPPHACAVHLCSTVKQVVVWHARLQWSHSRVHHSLSTPHSAE
jgi:hypothetical protein